MKTMKRQTRRTAPPPLAPPWNHRRRLRTLQEQVTGGGVAALPTPDGPGDGLLTDDQVKSFITDGFLVVVPEDLPRPREEFAAEVYAKAKVIAGPSAPGGGAPRSRDIDEELWAAITPEVNAVLASRSTHGALCSLLGPDYLAPPGNSLLHVSQPSDQGYHKDGTDHGPTMSTVRDHRPRHVIVMYYPIETTVDLGPTTILPRTQYTSVDREGFHNSEERLSPFMRPPTGADPVNPTEVWQAAHSRETAYTAGQSLEEQDATRIAHAIELLGDATLAEKKMVLPAGAVLICHIDIYHRASRKSPDAPWRPMFAVRSVSRVSDPPLRLAMTPDDKNAHDDDAQKAVTAAAAASADATAPDEFGHIVPGAPASHKAVWETMLAYMRGEEGVHSSQHGALPCAASVSDLEAQMMQSGCEMTRVGSGYQLGALAVAVGCMTDATTPEQQQQDAALGALQRALLHPAESTRRAAAYGLTAAGPAAVPWLLSLLRSPTMIEATLRSTAALTSGAAVGDTEWHPSPQPNVDVIQGIIVQVVHAVAHCATAAAATAAIAASAVESLGVAMRRAAAEIIAITAAATPDELERQAPHLNNMYQGEEPLNFAVIERKRTIAEGCVALGLIGAQAVQRGDTATAWGACDLLLEVVVAPEPGMEFASFMTRRSVTHNGALGLVRLTSDRQGKSGAAVPALHTGGGWSDAEGQRRAELNDEILCDMVGEAVRRGAERLQREQAGPQKVALEGVMERIMADAVPSSWPSADRYLVVQ